MIPVKWGQSPFYHDPILCRRWKWTLTSLGALARDPFDDVAPVQHHPYPCFRCWGADSVPPFSKRASKHVNRECDEDCC
jgi:hypothetical protein